MPELPRRYRDAQDAVGLRPSPRTDWAWLLLLTVLTYAFACAVRLADAPAWRHPSLIVGGEYIAATHDAYAWLAGALGVGDFTGYAFTGLTRFLLRITGAEPGNLAFWGPAFLGALAAPVTLFWGWFLGGRTAGLTAGLLGAILPGFFVRTRLGYWDTDLFTLFGSLLAALFLACLVGLRTGRFGNPAERSRPVSPLWALAAGVVARLAALPHSDIFRLDILSFALAVPLLLLLARGRERREGLRDLTVFGLAAFAGWRQGDPSWQYAVGLGAAAFLAFAERLPSPAARRLAENAWTWGASLLLLGLGIHILDPAWTLLEKAGVYLQPVAENARTAAGGPLWPGITQSIREARVVPLDDLLTRLSGSLWASCLGLLGFAVVLTLRPEAVLLLPMLGLGLSSIWLGNRFGMFAGPAVMLGLGVSLDFLLRRVLRGRRLEAFLALVGQGLLAAVLALPLGDMYRGLPATPVLDRVHAETLQDLGLMAPPDARIWTWWDFGYATQYFARRMTPTDGGRHAGRDIFPLALALTTPDARQAAAMIRFAASHGFDPASEWDRLPAAEVQAGIQGLDRIAPGPWAGPRQYLVVTWENLELAGWITFYGCWDVTRGQGQGMRAKRLAENFRLDRDNGTLNPENASFPIALGGLDVLSADGSERKDYGREKAPRLLINPDRRDAFLVDAALARSMLVRLLLDDPATPDLAASFHLVLDAFPHVRVYEVR